jgi:hypothetical protein
MLMRSVPRLSFVFSTAVVVAVSLTGIGSVSAKTSLPIQARATAAACPADYSADVGSAAHDMSTAAKANAVDKLAASALALIKLRYKLEDGAIPAGCETEQQLDVKRLALLEDGVLLALGSLLDAKNVNTYNDLVQKTWLPRVDALNAPATPVAGMPDAAATTAATAAAVCPDMAFTQAVGTDFRSLKLSSTETDPAVIGALGLKVLTLRYGYEDMTAPAGCDLARQFVAKFFLIGTDQLTLTLAKIGDKSNAATYDDFLKKDFRDRGTKILKNLSSFFDFSKLPPATAAATASK